MVWSEDILTVIVHCYWACITPIWNFSDLSTENHDIFYTHLFLYQRSKTATNSIGWILLVCDIS